MKYFKLTSPSKLCLDFLIVESTEESECLFRLVESPVAKS